MKPKLYVLLEKIRSAYNVGSVFRTADAAGIHKLYLTGYTAYPPHPKLQKTALGATESVSWEHHQDTIQLVKQIKKQRIRIITLESDFKAQSIFTADFTQDTCLIFGNEVTGVSEDIIKLSDQILTIPQLGIKSSLNIASAAAIAIYEFRRKINLPMNLEMY